MALGITIAGAVVEHFRGLAGDGIFLKVPAVENGVTDKLKTALGYGLIRTRHIGEIFCLGQYFRVFPVDVLAVFEVAVHGFANEKFELKF
jgi:hypothetical protein